MAKTAHSTTAPAPAQPGFIDPTTLPAGWSRRKLLAGAISIVPAAGLAALPVLPALAADEADPIFAAIEVHKAAAVRFAAAVDDEQRLEDELPADARQSRIWGDDMWIKPTDDPQWIAALKVWQETCDAVDDLAWEFIANPPTTSAGAAALLAYVESSPEGYFPDGCLPATYQMLARISARMAGGAS